MPSNLSGDNVRMLCICKALRVSANLAQVVELDTRDQRRVRLEVIAVTRIRGTRNVSRVLVGYSMSYVKCQSPFLI
jgi:hypothetical protein